MHAIHLAKETLVSRLFIEYNTSILFYIGLTTGVWIDCIRFEYMYGSRTLVEEIYKASLVCLEPDLIMIMTEEFEKLKDEFEYVL